MSTELEIPEQEPPKHGVVTLNFNGVGSIKDILKSPTGFSLKPDFRSAKWLARNEDKRIVGVKVEKTRNLLDIDVNFKTRNGGNKIQNSQETTAYSNSTNTFGKNAGDLFLIKDEDDPNPNLTGKEKAELSKVNLQEYKARKEPVFSEGEAVVDQKGDKVYLTSVYPTDQIYQLAAKFAGHFSSFDPRSVEKFGGVLKLNSEEFDSFVNFLEKETSNRVEVPSSKFGISIFPTNSKYEKNPSVSTKEVKGMSEIRFGSKVGSVESQKLEEENPIITEIKASTNKKLSKEEMTEILNQKKKFGIELKISYI